MSSKEEPKEEWIVVRHCPHRKSLEEALIRKSPSQHSSKDEGIALAGVNARKFATRWTEDTADRIMDQLYIAEKGHKKRSADKCQFEMVRV